MVKELDSMPGHDVVGYGVDLTVHHELFGPRQLHEYDAEVGAAQVEREELAELGAVGQLAHIGGEALDAGVLVTLATQAELDGLSHLLLHHVDVIVVQQQVAHAVLNQPEEGK